MARPTKLSDKLREQICSFIRQGMTYERACRLCHVSEATFYRWKAEGEKPGGAIRYREFLEAVKEADDHFILFHQQQVNRAAKKGEWKASLAMLERKARGDYARQYYVREESTQNVNIRSHEPEKVLLTIHYETEEENAARYGKNGKNGNGHARASLTS